MLFAALLVTGSAVFAGTKEVGPGIVYVPPADELFAMVNATRETNDLEPLLWSDELAVVAGVRAKELSESLSHIRPNGSEPQTAYKENNVSFSVAGENIAGGYEEALEVLVKWLGSKASKSNLLRENFTYAAIGTYDVVNADGTVTRYWAMEFMRPKSFPATASETPEESTAAAAGDIPDTDIQ